jgi:hypothetical protein
MCRGREGVGPHCEPNPPPSRPRRSRSSKTPGQRRQKPDQTGCDQVPATVPGDPEEETATGRESSPPLPQTQHQPQRGLT